MAPLFVLLGVLPLAFAGHDYGQALSKSILFFEAQRSGYLPSTQRVQWRGHSGLNDGKANGVDLVGGYYDAGDNVKFGLPMAFTITMMSWSIVEYGRQMAASGELGHAMDAVKWGTDYLIKAHPHPNVFYGEVGDGNTDHFCWQRPEDMTTSRQAYRLDPSNPGSDLAGESAAAMAAASLVFRRYNPSYANQLLTHAQQLFEFADKYRGKYDSSITVAQKYYRSVSGYADELLWAAAWLFKATNNQVLLELPCQQWRCSRWHRLGNDRIWMGREVCRCSDSSCQVSNGRQSWSLCTDGTTCSLSPGASFLLSVYSDYLTSARKNLNCASGSVSPSELLSFAKSQVDYILGDNPRATSYMVGYGSNYPRQVHHRASSIVSIKVNPSFVSCRGGYATWFSRKASDPNILTGAIVGGPDAYDNFADERDNYEQTEPATYNNAPLLGILARLHGGHSGYNQLLPVAVPVPKTQPNPAPVTKTTPAQGSSSAPIAIEQKMTTSWTDKGKTYYRYSITVTNKSAKTLKGIHLSISKLYGPLWGLTKVGDSYVFPAWLNSLPAGKSLEFVYIHSASQADVSVSSYTLV
ncbi:glycosyl hydrolase 9C3 [Actinidia rufa]|uniref:Endoglucanase n=1 Tax=Actinidia rufa TaxID=165716 RepID=A0A7J0GZZ3_9ERIC|nr:glycosyl hydrolase 9C3 [Actinidia rufa]